MNENTHAFLIAVSRYPKDEGLHDLLHAEDNANKLRETLTSDKIGINRKNITTITNPEDKNFVLDKLDDVASQKGVRNLIVYYSGHGILDSDSHYLTLSNSTVEKIYLNGVKVNDISDILERKRKLNVIFIIDSCFSENAFDNFHARNFLLMASSAKNRTSKYPVDADYSAFTNEIIDALANGVDNSKNTITWRDVYRHTKQNLSQKGFPAPKISAQNEVDDVVIAQNSKKNDHNETKNPQNKNELPPEIQQKSKEIEEEISKNLDFFKELNDSYSNNLKSQLKEIINILAQYQQNYVETKDPLEKRKIERLIDSLKEKIAYFKNELKEAKEMLDF